MVCMDMGMVISSGMHTDMHPMLLLLLQPQHLQLPRQFPQAQLPSCHPKTITSMEPGITHLQLPCPHLLIVIGIGTVTVTEIGIGREEEREVRIGVIANEAEVSSLKTVLTEEGVQVVRAAEIRGRGRGKETIVIVTAIEIGGIGTEIGIGRGVGSPRLRLRSCAVGFLDAVVDLRGRDSEMCEKVLCAVVKKVFPYGFLFYRYSIPFL